MASRRALPDILVAMGRSRIVLACAAALVAACGGWSGGSAWMKEPLTDDEHGPPPPAPTATGGAPANPRASRTIGGAPPRDGRAAPSDPTGGGGRALGTFRNTYYHFPRESEHGGEPVALMGRSCETIARVPRGFYDAVCVQGSGSLARGGTVSFAKRDCACAAPCPRTNQRICFDALDPKAFPFGRGAAGTAIVPLRTVAADTSVLPMGTVIYVPELDGAPRDDGGAPHDGCFVVEDRGLRVKGAHVDVFTGSAAQTARFERFVPSNAGVTVVVAAPKCAAAVAH